MIHDFWGRIVIAITIAWCAFLVWGAHAAVEHFFSERAECRTDSECGCIDDCLE